jgi:hypothetical protein
LISYELGSEDSTGVSSDAFAKPGLSVVAALTLAGTDKAFEASIVTADVLVGDATTVKPDFDFTGDFNGRATWQTDKSLISVTFSINPPSLS